MYKLEKLKKIDVCEILEFIMGVLIILQAVKKGGFYISDMNYIILFALVISFLYSAIAIKRKEFRLDFGSIILLFFAISYFLPVIFNTYADKESAIWETFKYLEMFSIYLVVINSKNRKKYEIILIILALVIGIFGIDGIACRYFEIALKNLNSGYLSSYLERLSSTIQYANTCAIIEFVGFMLSLKMLYDYISKLASNYTNYNINKCKYLYLSSAFLLVSILLTQSRFVIILTIVGTILMMVLFRKQKNFINIVVTLLIFVTSSIFSAIISNFIYNDYFWIYPILIAFIVISAVIFQILLFKVIMNVKLWYILENRRLNKKYILIAIIITAIYILLATNLTTSLEISNTAKDISAERYLFIEDTNLLQNISLELDRSENAKYFIEVYEQKQDGSLGLLLRFDDLNSSNTYNAYAKVKQDSKYLVFKFNCSYGKINVRKVTINGKNLKLNYILIPTDMMVRLSQKIVGSVSTNVRIEYIKDAIKIFKSSPVIGRGGEAFRYLYKQVQENQYTSTEVHSSFIQILIESGIIGEILILIYIIYIIAKGKNSRVKLIFILFVLHSLFDLNFSYAISTMIFAVLSGIIEIGKNEKNVE